MSITCRCELERQRARVNSKTDLEYSILGHTPSRNLDNHGSEKLVDSFRQKYAQSAFAHVLDQHLDPLFTYALILLGLIFLGLAPFAERESAVLLYTFVTAGTLCELLALLSCALPHIRQHRPALWTSSFILAWVLGTLTLFHFTQLTQARTVGDEAEPAEVSENEPPCAPQLYSGDTSSFDTGFLSETTWFKYLTYRFKINATDNHLEYSNYASAGTFYGLYYFTRENVEAGISPVSCALLNNACLAAIGTRGTVGLTEGPLDHGTRFTPISQSQPGTVGLNVAMHAAVRPRSGPSISAYGVGIGLGPAPFSRVEDMGSFSWICSR